MLHSVEVGTVIGIRRTVLVKFRVKQLSEFHSKLFLAAIPRVTLQFLKFEFEYFHLLHDIFEFIFKFSFFHVNVGLNLINFGFEAVELIFQFLNLIVLFFILGSD